ncbi:MAG TPA: chorismate lyase [Methylococcaceae bacterium]|nr:chorismate lyase [Methylococcaceae bacterium]HIN68034.1 chorismate lyase [Methylococcales bacterium]HIA44622.1 chorismate lyase [Methylococcaceae bacterium]HIB62171.1 chorismate lyase [Methylococcaceae bacterium]HIO13036.1 chorismate lyase [Methylococcales bacterium]
MLQKSYLLQQAPKWSMNRIGSRHQMPVPVQSWVYEPGSLTQRLRDRYGTAFTVQLVFQQWRRPFRCEQELLHLSCSHQALIREVILSANDKPLLLARTVIPRKTLKGAQRILSRLGNRPLGEVIFSYPKLQRMEMDFSQVDPRGWGNVVADRIGITEPIWGRRTVYRIKKTEMLVNEFFLPELINDFHE